MWTTEVLALSPGSVTPLPVASRPLIAIHLPGVSWKHSFSYFFLRHLGMLVGGFDGAGTFTGAI